GRTSSATRDLASVTDPLRECFTQFLGVRRAEVDLVGDAVEGERHGLVGRPTVDVVDENYLNLLCHCATSRLRELMLVSRSVPFSWNHVKAKAACPASEKSSTIPVRPVADALPRPPGRRARPWRGVPCGPNG